MDDATPPSRPVHEALTAVRRQGADLRAAQEVAHQIVETVRAPLLVLTPDFCVQAANPAFYQLFQVTPAETEGRPLYQLGHGQWHSPEVRRLLEELVPQQTVCNDYEVRQDFERIGPRTLLLNARRLEHVPCLLLAMEDITVRQPAEPRLDALRTLIRGSAHELNNLLAVILGYTELVQQNISGDTRSQANLQCVITATLRAKAVLEQLLTVDIQ
jgi:nitrogen-specific signal transduction histidine kinase